MVQAAKVVSICLCFALAALISSDPAKAVEVGDTAPAFEIETLDGEIFRLSDYRGKKPVYLVFWNTWCSYCVKKHPRYRRLQEELGDRIAIVAVNTTWSDSLEEIEQFRGRLGADYPLAFDNHELVTDLYGVSKVPTEFIVDLDGVIRYRDGVPEYVATHLPDWLQPYTPDMNTTQWACKK